MTLTAEPLWKRHAFFVRQSEYDHEQPRRFNIGAIEALSRRQLIKFKRRRNPRRIEVVLTIAGRIKAAATLATRAEILMRLEIVHA